MEDLEILTDRLRTTVFKKRPRINEFFRDYDPLRSGFVTENQFCRCMDVMQLGLNDKEFDLLMRVYGDESRGPKMVDYFAFSAFIDKVFTENDLESEPRKDLYDIRPKLLESLKPNSDLTIDEILEVKEMLARFKDESDHRGYIIKTCFKDFDPLRSGIVTKAQFLSCLPFQNVSQREKQFLIKRYGVGTDFVNYMLFHEETEGQLDEATGIGKDFLPTEATITSSNDGHLSNKTSTTSDIIFFDDTLATEAENIIRRQLLQHRVRIDDMMRDFDPLNHGCITPSQFKQSIGVLKLPGDRLSERQIEALNGKYTFVNRDETELVDYRSFVEEMNRVFTEKDLQSRPLATVHVPRELLATSKRSLPLLAKEKRVQELLDELRETIRTRRIFLKPVFQDFDKTQKGTYLTQQMTRTRFSRALAMLDLMVSAQDCQLLCERYDSDNDGNVNYVMFIDDVDFEERTFSMS